MTDSKINLKDVVDQLTTKFTEAIDAKKQGVAYCYICGQKVLTVSIENIVKELPEAKEERKEEVTKKEGN